MSSSSGQEKNVTDEYAESSALVAPMEPLQLEISDVALELTDQKANTGLERQMLYVDISWRGKAFRTTAQIRPFDPLGPQHAALSFDADKPGILTATPPLNSQDQLLIRLRKCDIFGDQNKGSPVGVTIMDLPLVRNEVLPVRIKTAFTTTSDKLHQQHVSRSVYLISLRALNFGREEQAEDQNKKINRGGQSVPTAYWEYEGEELRNPHPSSLLGKGKRKAKKEKEGAVKKHHREVDSTVLEPPLAQGEMMEKEPDKRCSLWDEEGEGELEADAVLHEDDPCLDTLILNEPVGKAEEEDRCLVTNNNSSATASSESIQQQHNKVQREEKESKNVDSKNNSTEQRKGIQNSCTTSCGHSSWYLEIIKDADPFHPLRWKGEIPPVGGMPTRMKLRITPQNEAQVTVALQPPMTANSSHPSNMRDGGVKSPSGHHFSLSKIVDFMKDTAIALEQTIDHEVFYYDFPEVKMKNGAAGQNHQAQSSSSFIRLLDTFSPSMLNGHGAPIGGKLYITPTQLYFHGSPCLHEVIALKEVVFFRQIQSFGDPAVQMFVKQRKRTTGNNNKKENGEKDGADEFENIVYQFQHFDGIASTITRMMGLRDKTKFFQAMIWIGELWLRLHEVRRQVSVRF